MRAVACAVLCCCVAMPASATTLFRCVSANGVVAYQDEACDARQVETRRIVFEPEVDTGKRPSRAKPSKAGVRGKPASRSASGSDSRSRARTACSAARQEREVALARAGLGRTFEQLRKLDDAVREACKGL
jgi:hypothetical protein